MLWHVVLMKPKPDLAPSDRAAFIGAFKRAVREIPTVRDVRVGKRVAHGAGYELDMPHAADYIAIIEFDDVAGVQTYLRHPAHAELGARFGQSFSAAWVYDFEMSEAGLAPLDAGGFV